MKNLTSIAGEQVCDLVDGRLTDADGATALQTVLSDPQALQAWHAYHVIGDVLRSPELAPRQDDFAFLAKLELRLAQEPARPQVVELAGPLVAPIVAVPALAGTGQQPANAAVFRWKVLAGVACAAFVGVLGVNLWMQPAVGKDAQMASHAADPAAAPLVVATQANGGAMIRDPRLDELMAAHRQLGGHSALQVPAEFLRNATYEGSNR